ncbi:MAG: hypothetical protein Q7J70_02920 [Thermodesulfovibrionales bacterium]|nr:hypothetical protein [Thermodesulfovibrionales bacterium]
MTLNLERERFNNSILLFNNQSLSISIDSSNILSLKFSPDEIGRTIYINSPMRVNLYSEGDFSLCNWDIEMSVRIPVLFKIKVLWNVPNGFPDVALITPENLVPSFLCKTPVLPGSPFSNPLKTEIQTDGRIRRRKHIEKAGKYLRVILLENGKTVHNAFFDRGFKEG